MFSLLLWIFKVIYVLYWAMKATVLLLKICLQFYEMKGKEFGFFQEESVYSVKVQ